MTNKAVTHFLDITGEVCPLTLERRFKAAVGVTPLGYLQRVRMEAAKRLWEETDRSFERSPGRWATATAGSSGGAS